MTKAEYIRQAFAMLEALSPEDFATELKRHRDTPIAQALRDGNFEQTWWLSELYNCEKCGARAIERANGAIECGEKSCDWYRWK